MNKSTFALLVCILFFSEGRIYAAGDNKEAAAKGVVGLLAIGASRWAINKSSESPVAQKISKMTNLHPSQVKNITSATIGLATLAMCWDAALWPLALCAPIVGLMGPVIISKPAREIIKEVPLIGDAIICPEKDCRGSCPTCFPTKGMALVAIWLAVRTGLEKYQII